MRLDAEVRGRRVRIELEPSGDDLRLRIDGREVAADAVWVSPTELSLRLDGRSHDLTVHPLGHDRVQVLAGGRTLVVATGSAGAPADVRHARGGIQSVEAPMPGKVVAVLVKEGERVEAGRGVVVVEAMKMENELAAPEAGVVRRVHVRVGQVVEGGMRLVEIGEPEPAGEPG